MKISVLVFALFFFCFGSGCGPSVTHRADCSTAADIAPSDPGDNFDWQHKSAIDFLNMLKGRTAKHPYTVVGVHRNWIKKSDIPHLIELLDSSEPCGAVARVISSYIEFGGSTVGNEAAFLIVGFQKGEYPPGLNSTRPRISQKEKDDLKQWWAGMD